ncbi:rhomboid family intramembrane serine protease [Sediminibacterium roseum]|uniref:Rhomboid family intramembrane serine protease n=1 Tax=Sediminibacterium roseum TaxID=1978412 RepID=A0ABW9ZT38_9BACT|nr:rhomboid family intramembrane serine protease [Sediminibacterium roseum]NCI50297.1 rhomboid family intramembrane serine protease [Sediminibacterium roseum]
MVTLTATIIILLLTCVVSFTAFSNDKIINDLIFHPPAITNRKQWYRFLTSGFIHADFVHLAFNMYTFFLFGNKVVEPTFIEIFHTSGKMLYVVLYLTALVVCLLPTYLKHKNDYHYRSLGASGAVSAIIFVGIVQYPMMKLQIFPLPIPIPAFIFGPLYLGISAYLAKKGRGNINHSAHIWGAVYGIVFYAVTCQFLTDERPLQDFVTQVKLYLENL